MFTMRRVVVSSVLALGLASASEAATILLDQCSVAGLCNQVGVTTTLTGSAIDVDVFDVAGSPVFGIFGKSGANRAFGFNVVDPDAGVAISDVSTGFSYASGVHHMGGGFGDFEFVINGPGSGAAATLPLHFRVTRTGGFTSDLDLFEANDLGYFFNAHARNAATGVSGFVTTKTMPVRETRQDAVPEPAVLAMLGLGLAVTARKLRAARR